MGDQLLQVIDRVRYNNSYINGVHINQGIQAAAKVLAYGSDENGVFSYDEATYYLLDPVLERYPNSFKNGGNIPNTNAVLCTLLHIGIIRVAPEELGHTYIDNPEGVYMLSHISSWVAGLNTRNLKNPLGVKRYRIPEWLFLENHDRPTLPDSLGKLKDAYRRKTFRRGLIWEKE